MRSEAQGFDLPRRAATMFAACAAWIVFAILVSRIASLFVPAAATDLVYWFVTCAVLLGGFRLLARTAVPDLRPLSSVGFVQRPSAGRELALGVAVGWALALALVLPAALTAHLSVSFAIGEGGIASVLTSLLTLIFHALALQLVLAGLPFRLLMRAAGPGWAAVAVVVTAGLLTGFSHAGDGSSMMFAALAAALCCAGFLRTHAIWLSLGLYTAWTVSLTVLFGVPSPYTPAVNSPVQGLLSGPRWLTGAPYGPETSALAPLLLLGAIAVVVRLTRDYAWNYTFQPIEGAGYAMDVAPPAQHVRMEEAAARPPALVQIQAVPGPVPVPGAGTPLHGDPRGSVPENREL